MKERKLPMEKYFFLWKTARLLTAYLNAYSSLYDTVILKTHLNFKNETF